MKIFIIVIIGITLLLFLMLLLSNSKKIAKNKIEPRFEKIVIKTIENRFDYDNQFLVLKGSFLNKRKSTFFVESKAGHCLVVGGSGTGKTEKYFKTLLFVNAYLSRTENIIITDLKGDETELNEFGVYGSLYKEYCGFLEEIGYKVYKLDFIASNWNKLNFSNKFNLLNNIFENRKQKFIVKNLITEFVQQLFPLKNEKDRYWIDTSRNIVSAIIEYMIDVNLKEKHFNLVNLIYIWNHFDEYVEYYWTKKQSIDFDEVNDPVIKMIQKNIQIINSKSFREVISTITTELNKFNDLILQTICSQQDFTLKEFYSQKSVLFLLANNQNENYNILVSIILKQLIDYKVLQEHNKKKMILLLDEFNNFGKINQFENYLDTSRSKNIFFVIGIQSITKFEQKYGSIEQFSNNFLASYLFGTTSNQNEIDYFNNYYQAKEKINKSFDAKGNFKSLNKTTIKDKIIDDNLLKINESDMVWIKERGNALYGTHFDFFSKKHHQFYRTKTETKMETKNPEISPTIIRYFQQRQRLSHENQKQVLNQINSILKTESELTGMQRDSLRKKLEKIINKDDWYQKMIEIINNIELSNKVKEKISELL